MTTDPQSSPRSAILRWAERALFLIALACLGTYAYVALDARFAQQAASERFAESLARQAQPAVLPGDADAAAPASPAPLHPGDVVGRLEIPRVGISVMVFEGDGDDVLRQAAGHIPGTGLPENRQANVGIAGHRDTFFRPLKDIHEGDEIVLTTAGGTFRYAVDSTRVVPPEEVSVLAPRARPLLTLVTCYPFYYVGHAPKRFVVQAALTSR